MDEFRFAFQVREDDGNVTAEFPNKLAAGAARRRERIGVRHHGNGIKAALAFTDGLENGATLGAEGESIAGIFDVATAEDSSRSGAKSCAYAKV